MAATACPVDWNHPITVSVNKRESSDELLRNAKAFETGPAIHEKLIR